MKILITGVNGFIGKHLFKKLIEHGHKVSGLGRNNRGVLNKELVEKAVQGVDVAIHLAALTSHKDIVDNKFETLETNLEGTKNVLEAFTKSKKAKKFFYASTGKVYGKIVRLPISEEHPTNPLNILGKSKLITENLIDFYADNNKEFVIFRIFQIYGSGQSENFLVPTIFKQLNRSNKIVLGDIKAKRDYIYIDDVINAFILAIEGKNSKGLSIFNICCGESYSAIEIVKKIGKIRDIKINIKTDPARFRHDEMDDEYGSYAKAKKTFEWQPTINLEQGLRKMMNGGTKALILAGGEGKRMKQKFPKIPKLLIPINGEMFLDYLVKYLEKNDVGSVVFSTGYLGDKVEKHLRRSKYLLPLEVLREEKPLGTGGAISFAKRMIDDDVFLLFGDVYTEVNLKKMLAFHRKNKALITCAVHKSRHPEDSNLIEFDSAGKVKKVLIKPHGKSGKNLYNLAALYILSADIKKYLPRKANYDFEKGLLFKLVDENLPVYAYNTSEMIMDFGTPERLRKLEGKLLHK